MHRATIGQTELENELVLNEHMTVNGSGVTRATEPRLGRVTNYGRDGDADGAVGSVRNYIVIE